MPISSLSKSTPTVALVVAALILGATSSAHAHSYEGVAPVLAGLIAWHVAPYLVLRRRTTLLRALAYGLSFPLFLLAGVWLAATWRVGAWPLFTVAGAPGAAAWLAWFLHRYKQASRSE